jgi:hypothetical protein
MRIRYVGVGIASAVSEAMDALHDVLGIFASVGESVGIILCNRRSSGLDTRH